MRQGFLIHQPKYWYVIHSAKVRHNNVTRAQGRMKRQMHTSRAVIRRGMNMTD